MENVNPVRNSDTNAKPITAFLCKEEVSNGVNAAFGELQERIRERGLLRADPMFYVRRAAFALALVAISIAVIIRVDHFGIQMANAVLLAFAFGQLGLILHDVGHGQVVAGRRYRAMEIVFDIILGWSLAWWVQKHNRHHAFPNQPGYDPDVGIAFLAFSEEQAHAKKGLYRFTSRYQNILFIPMLLGEVWHLRWASIAYLVRQRTLKSAMGILLIALHLVLYLGLLLYYLPWWQAAAFAAVHWGMLGIYLGMIFAPNHKGMPMFEHGKAPGYMEQQVLTSRNVRGGWLVDMVYGGLNYQIEHHLFPAMPRSRLGHAAPFVEAFCREKNIPYFAVGIRESLREIFGHFTRVGKAVDAAI